MCSWKDRKSWKSPSSSTSSRATRPPRSAAGAAPSNPHGAKKLKPSRRGVARAHRLARLHDGRSANQARRGRRLRVVTEGLTVPSDITVSEPQSPRHRGPSPPPRSRRWRRTALQPDFLACSGSDILFTPGIVDLQSLAQCRVTIAFALVLPIDNEAIDSRLSATCLSFSARLDIRKPTTRFPA